MTQKEKAGSFAYLERSLPAPDLSDFMRKKEAG